VVHLERAGTLVRQLLEQEKVCRGLVRISGSHSPSSLLTGVPERTSSDNGPIAAQISATRQCGTG
jgi:hypothetical protein